MIIHPPQAIRIGFLAFAIAFGPVSVALGQQTQDSPGQLGSDVLTSDEVKAIFEALDLSVDLKDFQGTVVLKEAFGTLMEHFAKRNMDLAILVDVQAFQENDPNLDVMNIPVKLAGLSGEISAKRFLQECIGQIPGHRAALLYRKSYIEITTVRSAQEAAAEEGFLHRFLSGRGPTVIEIPAQDNSHSTMFFLLLGAWVGLGLVLGLCFWVKRRSSDALEMR